MNSKTGFALGLLSGLAAAALAATPRVPPVPHSETCAEAIDDLTTHIDLQLGELSSHVNVLEDNEQSTAEAVKALKSDFDDFVRQQQLNALLHN